MCSIANSTTAAIGAGAAGSALPSAGAAIGANNSGIIRPRNTLLAGGGTGLGRGPAGAIPTVLGGDGGGDGQRRGRLNPIA